MALNKTDKENKFIYKVCDRNLWLESLKVGVFVGAEIDLNDGFIHFSTADQLQETLERYFFGQKNLMLLKVETNKLQIKWELAREHDLFPHLYDDLPLNCIVEHHHLACSATGTHIVPKNFLVKS